MAAALSVSGFDAQRFSFLGFLPRKPGRHRKALEAALARNETIVIYESPYRVAATLETLAALSPSSPVAVCRELTKKFEEVLRGTAGEASAELKQRKEIRGEFVLVVGASDTVEPDEQDET